MDEPSSSVELTEAEREALKSLRTAGGRKLWSQCEFTFAVLARLSDTGFVEYDRNAVPNKADVRLTEKGQKHAPEDKSTPWWKIVLFVLFGPTLLILPLEIIYFVGNVQGAGFLGALDLWRDWLYWPIILTGFAVGILLLVLVIAVIQDVWTNAKVNENWPRLSKIPKVVGTLIGVGAVGLFVCLILWTIYDSGKIKAREHHKPAEDPDKALAEGKDAITKQRAAVDSLSDSARDLLTGLDKTEVELARAKEQVTDTLTKLSTQQEAVKAANKELNGLLKKQQDLRFQQQQIDQVFSGRYIPTRDEVSRSSLVQTGIGFVFWLFGIITSLIAAWIWERWLKNRLRRGSHAPPPSFPPTDASSTPPSA